MLDDFRHRMDYFASWPRADVIAIFGFFLTVLIAIAGILTLQSRNQRILLAIAVLITASVAMYYFASNAAHEEERAAAEERARHNDSIREATIRAQQELLERQAAERAAKESIDRMEIERRAHAQVAQEKALEDARRRILLEDQAREERASALREELALKDMQKKIIGKWIAQSAGVLNLEFTVDGHLNHVGVAEQYKFVNRKTIVTNTWCCSSSIEISNINDQELKLKITSSLGTGIADFKRPQG